MQLLTARGSEFVGLLLSGRIVLLETLDPKILQEPAERSIEGSRAQPNAPIAERFNILHQAVAMAGFLRQAQQDQQNRFGEGFTRWFITHNNMSPYAIL
jgi:hypothetical protein